MTEGWGTALGFGGGYTGVLRSDRGGYALKYAFLLSYFSVSRRLISSFHCEQSGVPGMGFIVAISATGGIVLAFCRPMFFSTLSAS
jgi:hypothetical protein